jgi:hypothetical protein
MYIGSMLVIEVLWEMEMFHYIKFHTTEMHELLAA